MKISFSLRLLFAFIAVATLLAGVLIRYYEVEQRFANENAHFNEIKAEHDTGPRIYMQVSVASLAHYSAERDRWFRTRNARESKIKRLSDLEVEAFAKRAGITLPTPRPGRPIGVIPDRSALDQ
jgi:hypothetical protein